MTVSVVMITKNSAGVVGEALASIRGLWSELLVGDAVSTDGTVEIIKKYGGRIIRQTTENLGKRKQQLVEMARGDWILILDADERLSGELREEMGRLEDGKAGRKKPIAYKICYQNYVFGKPVYYGGEKYAKVRLFKNGFGRVREMPLHEEIEIRGKVGELKGSIHHQSYRSPAQLFSKFTAYARIAAQEQKTVSPKKLFFYGPHMLWARFVKEEGYRDGWRGFVLALAFAYMETLTYWLLLVKNKKL